MAQTKGHVLAHKTLLCHDPASRLAKIMDKKAESWQYLELMCVVKLMKMFS